MSKIEAQEQDEQELEQLRKAVPNPLTRWSIVLMIIGFLLLAIPMIFFPFKASPALMGFQAVAQFLGLPVLAIGFVLLFVGLMRAGSTR